MIRAPLITSLNYADADLTGVHRFAQAMTKRLAEKREEGKRGWNTTPSTGWGCTIRDLELQLKKHIEKGDLVNIANLSMMIWNRRNPRGLE